MSNNKGKFKAILVGVCGNTIYFRDSKNPSADVFPVENAKISYNLHDFGKILNKTA